jgi:hypothetical protein
MDNTSFALPDKAVDTPANNRPSSNESWTDKALREVHLLGQGAAGIFDAAKQSVSSDHRLETAGEVALSIGTGLGLAYMTRGRSLGYLAGRALATAGTLAFLKDAGEHGALAANAMGDAWRSDKNMQQDAKVMKECLGSFAFDTALMSVGGLAGGKAGRALFKPEIPPLFFDQMNDKTGIRMDYYNKFYGAESRANMAVNSDGATTQARMADAREKLPGFLRDVRTYSNYWDDQIASFEKYHPEHPKLDAKGIKNFLVNDRPEAMKLDRLGGEMRSYAEKDLNDPQVMSSLFDKFQRGRHIIYGDNPLQARRMISDGPLTASEMSALNARYRGGFAKTMALMRFRPGDEAGA